MQLKHLQLVSAVLVLLNLTACGPTEEQIISSAEKPLTSQSTTRKKPAFVRLVNLSEQPLTPLDGQRTVCPEVKPGEASRLAPIGASLKAITFGSAARAEVPVEPQSGLGSTVIVLPDDNVAVVEGEQITPSKEGNVRVVLVGEDHKVDAESTEFKLEGGTGPVTVTSGKVVDLPTGSYSFPTGKDGVSSINVEGEIGYTFLFIKHKGQIIPYFLANRNKDRPIAGAASGT